MKGPIEFPQYRKLSNGKSWYALLSAEHMIEYQLLGSKAMKHELKATLMPERWAIKDVLECANGNWESIDESEFRQFLDGLIVIG